MDAVVLLGHRAVAGVGQAARARVVPMDLRKRGSGPIRPRQKLFARGAAKRTPLAASRRPHAPPRPGTSSRAAEISRRASTGALMSGMTNVCCSGAYLAQQDPPGPLGPKQLLPASYHYWYYKDSSRLPHRRNKRLTTRQATHKEQKHTQPADAKYSAAVSASRGVTICSTVGSFARSRKGATFSIELLSSKSVALHELAA